MKNVKLTFVASAIVLCLSLAFAFETALAAYVVHGNYKTRIYHNQNCRYFNCKACTVVFESAEEAISSGYRACKVCGG